MLFQTTRAPFFAHQKKHSIFANFLKTGLASTLILTGACSAARAAGIELCGGGPTELSNRVEADVSEDVSVFWNNDISDAASALRMPRRSGSDLSQKLPRRLD